MLLYDDRPSTTRIVNADTGLVSPPQKLLVLENTTDGFQIAEADLALRGALAQRFDCLHVLFFHFSSSFPLPSTHPVRPTVSAGPGDFFGFRQSGSYGYRATVLSEHAHLLPEAQQMARSIDDDLSKHGYDEHIVGLMNLFPEPAPAGTAAPSPIIKSTASVASKPISSPQKRKLEKGIGLTASPVLEQLEDPVFVLLDLETTGLNTKKVITIATSASALSLFFPFTISLPSSLRLSFLIPYPCSPPGSGDSDWCESVR